MRLTTDTFLERLGVSHKWATTFTCTVPGGGPVTLKWSDLTVNASNGSAARYQATANVLPLAGSDTYALVSTPGAVFKVRQGIDAGAGDVEYVDLGVFEAATGSVDLLNGGVVALTLVDLWQRIERCRFTEPYAPATGTRASLIAAAVTAAIPGVVVSILADGGTFTAGQVWDRDRAQFIKDMANDGQLDVYFDAAGVFVIRLQPIIDVSAVAWTFVTGVASNTVSASRQRPFDRLYNTVVAIPQDETQTWARQKVTIADTDNPRHVSKIGEVPYFYSSPTLTTADSAFSAITTILQRILGTSATISLGVFGNPALEIGDAIAAAISETNTDPGIGDTYLLESFGFNCATGEMSCQARTQAVVDVEAA